MADHDAQMNEDVNEVYGNDSCAECGHPLKRHFDSEGYEGKGAWCSTGPDDMRHFIQPATPPTAAPPETP